jgi:hypothetical protein
MADYVLASKKASCSNLELIFKQIIKVIKSITNLNFSSFNKTLFSIFGSTSNSLFTLIPSFSVVYTTNPYINKLYS